MTRNQTASQRAAGATSRSPSRPKALVSPSGSKSLARLDRPKSSTEATATTHTAMRVETNAAMAVRSPGVGSAAIGPILADTFLERHDNVITAVASVLVALVLAWLVDRALRRAYARRPQALMDPA